MSKNMRMLLAGVLFLAAAYKIQAADQRLQCWQCSSDTIGAEDFCGITFQESNIPTDEMKKHDIIAWRHCNSTTNSEHERAVCRKTVEEMNGKTVTKRFCYYNNKSDSLDNCLHDNNPDKSVRRTFCQDCLTDKCNSAPQVAAMLSLMLLLVLVAEVFVV